MATPHIEAKKGEIASTVIMPGDPLRAKFIAETYLENPKLVNQVRGILAYTGTYKGHNVTVMASGMGMPSIGIYSYELFTQYDVEKIIRVGSAGAYSDRLKLMDVVLAESVWSESSFAKTQNGFTGDTLYPDKELNAEIIESAKRNQIPLKLVKVHSCDVFYCAPNMKGYKEIHAEHGCECIDMESFALFHNANVCGKQAACLLTISDSFVTEEKLSSADRQTAFGNMIQIALESCCK